MAPLRLALAAAIVLATAAVYGESVHFGFVHYDDLRYVRDNPWLADGLTRELLRFAVSFEPAAIHQGVSNWHPLTWLSYALDVSLFGIDPRAMHAVNALLHALNALLVFALFDRTTRAPLASACVAGLFAVHPLHVEAVAWIAERKELLAALFGLLACHAWMGFARRRGAARYGAALLCATLSLLAKPMWVTLPFLLLVLDYWPLRRDATGLRRLVVEKLPFLTLSILSGAITLYAQRAAMDAASAASLSGRILNAIAAPIDYLALALWPRDLSVLHPHPYLPGGTTTSALAWCGIAACWLAGLGAVWRSRARRYGVAGLAWFLVALVPVLGLVQVGEQAIAERYTYVPFLGIYAALVFGLRDGLATRARGVKGMAAALALVAFGLLGARAAERVGAWRDTITLYERSLRATPTSATLHYNLGNRLLDAGREAEAIRRFETARRLRPDWSSPTINLAWLLATTDDARLFDPARAVRLAREATEESDSDANALDTLAAAHAAAGDLARAERVAQRAVALALAGGHRGTARAFEGRRRLYASGERYVEPLRPGETPPPKAP